ncbi:MAG: 7-cyano-7-deazaguanine synthase, partial [Isosphaeraceae bacterium]|nr:7-cyano-7-deazaguanine synthase [Isosphaeraceae bacterium]
MELLNETSASGRKSTAILTSGGLDSAILLAQSLGRGEDVYPLYIRNGYFWEAAELAHLERWVGALRGSGLKPLQVLDLPVADLLPHHWSTSGREVPGADSPDEAVYLPARNALLLAKAMLWCHLKGVASVALAVLKSNPFPDATPEFFEAFQDVMNRAFCGAVQIRRPFADLEKTAVMHLGRGLPLEWTFSCIHPRRGRHCGACNKCAERRWAFAEAGMTDPTVYESDRLPGRGMGPG